jgi:hypothetical protein
MNEVNPVQKFEAVLPTIRQWIDDLLNAHKNQSKAVIDLAFPTLPQIFPIELLQKTRVVMMSGKIPYPPLSNMGFPPNFSAVENMAFSGVTYKDTYFLNQAYQQESLHFHELIHIVQWDTLGVDNFLRAYGVGLLQSGYRRSPLEDMAYSLQMGFENGSLRKTETVELVKKQTQALWDSIKQLFPIA